MGFLLLKNGKVKHRQTLDVLLELKLIGVSIEDKFAWQLQFDIYKNQFLSQNILFNSEKYDLILCIICFTAVLKTTICNLEVDLSQ